MYHRCVHQRPQLMSMDELVLMSHIVFDYEGDDIIAYFRSTSLFDMVDMKIESYE